MNHKLLKPEFELNYFMQTDEHSYARLAAKTLCHKLLIICVLVLIGFFFGIESHAQSITLNESVDKSFTPHLHGLSKKPSLPEMKNDSVNKRRLRAVIITEAAIFGGTLYGLYNLWYKDYPQSSFHFYNDNSNWLQVDKVGHGITAYYVGKIGYEALKWANVSEKASILYGGTLGFVYLLTIETLDGFSAEWGASAGDLLSNAVGSGIFIGQQLLWEEQRITFKYSFHQTKYADYRPDLFGTSLSENMLKDYNGQTLWASANLKSFTKKHPALPSWLNVAIGYSGEGMTGAATNVTEYNGRPIPDYQRHRQYFLSLDADLTKIKTESGFLKNLFNVIGFIKIPFPALEYNTKGQVNFHWFYF